MFHHILTETLYFSRLNIIYENIVLNSKCFRNIFKFFHILWFIYGTIAVNQIYNLLNTERKRERGRQRDKYYKTFIYKFIVVKQSEFILNKILPSFLPLQEVFQQINHVRDNKSHFVPILHYHPSMN